MPRIDHSFWIFGCREVLNEQKEHDDFMEATAKGLNEEGKKNLERWATRRLKRLQRHQKSPSMLHHLIIPACC